MNGTLTGSGRMIRFIVRRDRFRLSVWLVALTVLVASSAMSLVDTFPTAAERQSRADLMENPAFKAFAGPGYGIEDYTYGAMTANELLPFTAILVAVMSILLVVRHTRAEEESGRAELLRATAIGRHAPAAATLTVLVGLNAFLSLLVGAGLAAALPDEAVASSFLFGAGLGSVGLVSGAVALVLAQATEYSRAASGLALGVFGLFFVLRAAGDMSAGTGQSALSWLSPLGWAQGTKAYVDDRWWPLLLSLVFSAVLVAAAWALASRRDLGGGLWATRLGRAAAPSSLLSPVGLALRLQRTTLVGWGLGLLLFGVVYGSVSGDVQDFIEDSPTAADMLRIEGSDITDEFFASILSFGAFLATGFTLQSALRPRSEEVGGRAEPVLATAVSRARWSGGHLLVAAGGAVLMLLLGGLALGIAATVAGDEGGRVLGLSGAALTYAPALWAMLGLAVLLYGLSPRAALGIWAVLAYAAFVGMYGGLLGLPTWLEKLTPIGHTPRLPAEDPTVLPLVALVGVGAATTWLGQWALRRRDLQMS